MLIKEGAATDFTYKEDLAKLLKFESTALDAGKLTGLDDYVDRMAGDQEEILFLFGKSRESIESGPYPRSPPKRVVGKFFCSPNPWTSTSCKRFANIRKRKSSPLIRKS